VAATGGILRSPGTKDAPMSLNNNQRRKLKGRCHGLSPVVTVADKGLTENVMAEIENALDAHQLIKIKLRGDRDVRRGWLERIADASGAVVVQRIGHVACLFRRNPEKPALELD
jgi:RNA-binding protein